MDADIKNMTASELLALRDKIDLRLDDLAKELERQLLEIRDGAHGESRPALKKRRGIASLRLSPKYRNPADPSQTWAGRGKRPNWLVAALKTGKKLESFAIKK
jgi:DNA-binding protein H-NS